MKRPVPVKLLLCNAHLQALYRAIERGDVGRVYEVEHHLTPEEECVACAYALRAHGTVRKVLDTFLREEGFMVVNPTHLTPAGEVKFWLTRLAVLGSLVILAIGVGGAVKSFITGHRVSSLGGFGIGGAFLLAIAVFIIVDNYLLEG